MSTVQVISGTRTYRVINGKRVQVKAAASRWDGTTTWTDVKTEATRQKIIALAIPKPKTD